jgi:hypothetical protein
MEFCIVDSDSLTKIPCQFSSFLDKWLWRFLAPFQTDSFTQEASYMALTHNSFIRGFNTIYQQAPRTATSDYNAFIGYCLERHTCVEERHNYEESNSFPAIDKAMGKKDAMASEEEQHGMCRGNISHFGFQTADASSLVPRRYGEFQELSYQTQQP